MAKTDNVFFAKASGHVGKQFVFRQYGDKTLICKYPDMSKRVLSAKQLRVNKTMEEANLTARETMADEEKKHAAQVRLNVTSNKLYTSLIREHFAKNAQ